MRWEVGGPTEGSDLPAASARDNGDDDGGALLLLLLLLVRCGGKAALGCGNRDTLGFEFNGSTRSTS